jgi:hypothetical protein
MGLDDLHRRSSHKIVAKRNIHNPYEEESKVVPVLY